MSSEENKGSVPLIDPKILKGFRDSLPSSEIVRRNLIEKIEASFQSFGFVPIDTPALEYSEILLGKGGGETEKQIYRFNDNGGRDVALRFDLTVPFARFTALHKDEIIFPFKRYHIAKVWRGENTQRGRFREFMQCDFDIIGSVAPESDFEILLLIYSTLQKLGLTVNIKVNHRGLFNRFLTGIGAGEKLIEVLHSVDKLSKAGLAETEKELSGIAGEKNTQKILSFITAGADYKQTLDHITDLSGGPSEESDRMNILWQYIQDNGIGGSFTLDPSITRGLDYYTGVVFETFLTDLPDIGSICSGGRYDNLCGLYSKTPVSGVGSSIGLDRMIAAMESLNKLPAASGYTDIAIAHINTGGFGASQVFAQKLREINIPCEVFLEDSQGNLVKQYIMAEKKGIRWLVIPGEKQLDYPLTVRDITNRQNRQVLSFSELSKLIQNQKR